jgi:3-hydroxyacyl-[acyl-carrier-protein] dehydratase
MNKVTHWTVPADHPTFAGHFPGNPTVPGVVLLDIALHAITAATGIDLAVCEISTVKFLSPVSPNEQISIEHTILPTGAIRFEIVSDTRKIATGRVINHSDKSTT